jgi:phage antirepressor YoqD-like protein
MSKKTSTLSAKEVAAMCDMTPKNFRKHLRNLGTFTDRKEKRYAFTSKQAEKIQATLAAAEETEDVAAE